MKTPWVQTLAWLAAVIVAVLFALATPEEAGLDYLGAGHDLPADRP